MFRSPGTAGERPSLAAMDEFALSREGDGHIARLALNRPDKLNAQTGVMWLHLANVLGPQLVADPDIRVLILEGRGRSFSAGIDITTFTGGGGGSSDGIDPNAATGPRDPVESVSAVQRGFEWLETAPFLTIAKVHGHAFGAGMQLALACDVRIAADDVQMGLLETNWGLMPDLGGTVWLPRLVGPAKAIELMVTAEKLRADELLRLGIVNRVVPRDDLDATVDALAAQVAARPPLAVRGAKAAVRGGWGQDTETGMTAAAVAQLPCLSSEDFVEAAKAFLEQRTPVYKGR
jgi:enoyl-CoA hydratase/carnithine racemase